eukprot:s777_g36.t1
MSFLSSGMSQETFSQLEDSELRLERCRESWLPASVSYARDWGHLAAVLGALATAEDWLRETANLVDVEPVFEAMGLGVTVPPVLQSLPKKLENKARQSELPMRASVSGPPLEVLTVSSWDLKYGSSLAGDVGSSRNAVQTLGLEAASKFTDHAYTVSICFLVDCKLTGTYQPIGVIDERAVLQSLPKGLEMEARQLLMRGTGTNWPPEVLPVSSMYLKYGSSLAGDVGQEFDILKLPDKNLERQISVGTTARSDLSRERQISLGIAGPQPRVPDFSLDDGGMVEVAVGCWGPLRSERLAKAMTVGSGFDDLLGLSGAQFLLARILQACVQPCGALPKVCPLGDENPSHVNLQKKLDVRASIPGDVKATGDLSGETLALEFSPGTGHCDGSGVAQSPRTHPMLGRPTGVRIRLVQRGAAVVPIVPSLLLNLSCALAVVIGGLWACGPDSCPSSLLFSTQLHSIVAMHRYDHWFTQQFLPSFRQRWLPNSCVSVVDSLHFLSEAQPRPALPAAPAVQAVPAAPAVPAVPAQPAQAHGRRERPVPTHLGAEDGVDRWCPQEAGSIGSVGFVGTFVHCSMLPHSVTLCPWLGTRSAQERRLSNAHGLMLGVVVRECMWIEP